MLSIHWLVWQLHLAICKPVFIQRTKRKIENKERKQKNKVIFNQKELKSKGEQLRDLQFGPSLFMNGTTSFENQSLFYKCQPLKNFGKLFSFWFFNNTLNVKLTENSPIRKIFHIINLENLLQVDSTEELIIHRLNFNMYYSGPFRRFLTCVWQNTRVNTVRHAMVCNVYFPFPKIL